jgi:hypothetical protein
MSFTQTEIKIKRYTQYDDNGNHGFTGLRDLSCYSKIYIHIENKPYIDNLGTGKNSISTEEADLFNNSFSRKRVVEHPNMEYLVFIYNNSGDSNHRTNVLKIAKKVVHLGDYSLNEALLKHFPPQYPVLEKRPDLTTVSELENNTIIDLFYYQGNEIYVAEYQYTSSKYRHIYSGPANQNFPENRRASPEGVYAISVNVGNTYYALLSSMVLSKNRILSIKEKIKRGIPCARVTRISRLGTIINSILTVREGAQDKEYKIKEILSLNPDAENLIVDRGVVTVLLPDYQGFANRMSNTFDRLYRDFELAVGADDYEIQLKYVTSIACSFDNNWDELKRDNASEIRNFYRRQAVRGAKVYITALKFLKWILHPGYQEMLYDYLLENASENDVKKKLKENFLDYIDKLKQLNGTGFAELEWYCDNALKNTEEAFQKKNPGRANAYIDYLTNPQSTVKKEFENLDMYYSSRTTNWFAEVLCPGVKKYTDVSLHVLEAFSAPYVNQLGKRVAINRLPAVLQEQIREISKEKRVIIKSLSPNRNRTIPGYELLGEGTLITFSPDNMDIATQIATSNVLESLKKCVAVFDVILATYAYRKDPSASNAVGLFASCFDLGRAYVFITTGQSGRFEDFIIKNQEHLVTILGMLQDALFSVKLYNRGETAAAVVQLSGGMALGVIKIITAAIGIKAGYVTLALFILGMALQLGVSLLTKDDLERWIGFSKYGRYYDDLKKGGSPPRWNIFYKDYLELYRLNSNSTQLNTRKEIMDAWLNGFGGKPAAAYQIDCYHRVINNFSFALSNYYFPEWRQDAVCDFIKLEITIPNISIFFRFEVTVQIYDAGRLVFSKNITLDRNNSGIYKMQNNAFTINSFIYSSRLSCGGVYSRTSECIKRLLPADGAMNAPVFINDDSFIRDYRGKAQKPAAIQVKYWPEKHPSIAVSDPLILNNYSGTAQPMNTGL